MKVDQYKTPAFEDKLSNIELFLRATKPKGFEQYYNPRSPIIGKEVSIGMREREDMLANDEVVWTILELFYEGQIDFALDMMTWYQNDMLASMSVDGKLLDSLTSQEIRQVQKQEYHEFQHGKKEGILRR